MADSEVSWKSKLAHVAQSAISFFSDIISSKKTHEGPVVEVDGATITYTQLIVNKDGEQIVPLKHGANRDAARIGLISRTCGIFAVADGCGLSFWGEIAAHVAVNEFVVFMQHHIVNGCNVANLRDLLRAAIHHVNEKLFSVKNHKTKQVVNILDMGGSCTFVCGILFPYVGSLRDVVGNNSTPDGWGAESENALEEKWAVVCTGLGDSEVYCFRAADPPKQAFPDAEISSAEPSHRNSARRTSGRKSQNEAPTEHPETTDKQRAQADSAVPKAGTDHPKKPKKLSEHPKRAMSYNILRTEKSEHDDSSKKAKKKDEKSATLPLPQRRDGTDNDDNDSDNNNNNSSSKTPPQTNNTTPTGRWFRIFQDNGKSPFLPYLGLKDKHIPEPVVLPLRPGDIIVACSDGVTTSCNIDEFPVPSLDVLSDREGAKTVCKQLINKTIVTHVEKKTDPDDVTIAVLKLTSLFSTKSSKSKDVQMVPVEDWTSTFNQEFASSKSYNRDYLEEWLAEYPPHYKRTSNSSASH